MKQLQTLLDVRIGVVGDVILDRYTEGRVTRVSPEAPIAVVERMSERCVPGGAANVCHNLAHFGAAYDLIGVVGENDPATDQLLECLLKGTINQHSNHHLVNDPCRPTSTKTRIVGNGQQIVRVDCEGVDPVSGVVEQSLCDHLTETKAGISGLIVSDYAKGVISEGIAGKLRELAQDGLLVAVDPHPKNACDWTGVAVLKPNFTELKGLTGMEFDLRAGENPLEHPKLVEAVYKLMEMWSVKHILVTLSEHGMVYFNDSGLSHWEPSQVVEVYDVSGAGDTAITFFTLALCSGWSGVDAVKIANKASGLVVKKFGTASISFGELEKEFGEI